MALPNFDGPSVSLLQIQHLPGLMKQKESTAVLSVCILIGMPNQALRDVRERGKKEPSQLSSHGAIGHNMPNGEAQEEFTAEECQTWDIFKNGGLGKVF